MLIIPAQGLQTNRPLLSPQPFWRGGVNVRFWDGAAETIGLFGPLRGVDGNQITLPGADLYRSLFTTPSPTTGQLLAGSASELYLMEFDPGSSTPGAPPRWALFDVAPYGMTAETDALTDPPAARVAIPPVWWFADQDDVVVGSRANVALEPCYAWDRDNAGEFEPLANSPLGAVGGAIVNRILVLLGCTSFTDPDPLRFMTIRWSDRFNFEDWTPSDVNVSGELQLEGGSRIVGGGYTSFGVVAWTDKRMAVLNETGDPDEVFARRYVDGGRGLLANRAWCEADGIVWWLDATHTLNAYDGGRPRQLVNPLRYFTTERVSDVAAARIYLEPNPDYNEVIIHFPTGTADDNPDAQVVFNYEMNAWYYWQLPRVAWRERFGIIPNLAIDHDNKVYRHDLDNPFSAPWSRVDPLDAARWQLPAADSLPVAADVTAYDFILTSNLITEGAPASRRTNAAKIVFDHIPSAASGVSPADSLSVSMVAFGKPSYSATQKVDTRTLEQGQGEIDFRTGGKARMLRIEGVSQKTVWRFGLVDDTEVQGGQR